MTCQCEELRERVAYLESELGVQNVAYIQHRLSSAMRARNKHARWTKATGASRLIARMYAAHGKPVTTLQLLEAAPGKSIYDDRDEGIVRVWVCFARKTLGKDAVETVWGFGYRLSASGMAQVAEIVGDVL